MQSQVSSKEEGRFDSRRQCDNETRCYGASFADGSGGQEPGHAVLKAEGRGLDSPLEPPGGM